ncbi:Trm112 family protein [Terrabacter sp. BE26]|uniref:Trm112 family protein n=1 Tax=Terrabacter sp. BE26 TaxID=2898152 RepID=UPI0035BE6C8B
MTQSQQTIEPWLRGIIRCPQCKGELTDAVHGAGEGAGHGEANPETAELRCATCRLAYPVEGGVPVLLVELSRRTDG